MIFAAARTFSSGPCDAAPLQSADLRCARLARGPRACRERRHSGAGRLRNDRLFPDALVLGFLYFRLCRRWPVVGWLALGLIVGLFGGGYSNSTATTFIEREEYDDTNCDIYDNCDNCDN